MGVCVYVCEWVRVWTSMGVCVCMGMLSVWESVRHAADDG